MTDRPWSTQPVTGATMDVRLVQARLPEHFAAQSWPRFIVSAQGYVSQPRFCPDSCEGGHIAHMRKDQYWLCFANTPGEPWVRYRYVGWDQIKDETLWEWVPRK